MAKEIPEDTVQACLTALYGAESRGPRERALAVIRAYQDCTGSQRNLATRASAVEPGEAEQAAWKALETWSHRPSILDSQVEITGTDGDRYDILWGFEETRDAAGKAMRAAESALARRLTDRVTHPRKRATPSACPAGRSVTKPGADSTIAPSTTTPSSS